MANPNPPAIASARQGSVCGCRKEREAVRTGVEAFSPRLIAEHSQRCTSGAVTKGLMQTERVCLRVFTPISSPSRRASLSFPCPSELGSKRMHSHPNAWYRLSTIVTLPTVEMHRSDHVSRPLDYHLFASGAERVLTLVARYLPDIHVFKSA